MKHMVDPDISSVAPGLGRRVLLVDDDRIQRKLVAAQLADAGFVVMTADSAGGALRAVAQSKPDVIVSDVLMDDIDGFSLCRTLRKEATLATVPIVLMSAYFNEGPDRTLAREVGASALVTRGDTIQPCVEAIVRCLVESPQDVIMPTTSELHVNRVAHQLTRFRDESVRAEARYRTLFEHARDAISVLSSDGRVLDVNRRWEEITQRPREELIGKHVTDLAMPDFSTRRKKTTHDSDSPRRRHAVLSRVHDDHGRHRRLGARSRDRPRCHRNHRKPTPTLEIQIGSSKIAPKRFGHRRSPDSSPSSATTSKT